MSEIISLESQDDITRPLNFNERMHAQREILERLCGKDDETRANWVIENSGVFRELEKDPEVRMLIRREEFDEVAKRFELLRRRKKEEPTLR